MSNIDVAWVIIGLIAILLTGWWLLSRSSRKKSKSVRYEHAAVNRPSSYTPISTIDYAALRPTPITPPPASTTKSASAVRSYPIEDTGLVGDKRPFPPPPMPSIEELTPYLKAVTERPEPLTEHQLKAVQAIGFFGDATPLTNGQASAILSARSYMKGVMHNLSGGQSEDYPNEELIDANIVKFIIKEAELRTRVIEWNKRSHSRGYSGSSGGIPMPKKDGFYHQVAEEIKRILFTHRV